MLFCTALAACAPVGAAGPGDRRGPYADLGVGLQGTSVRFADDLPGGATEDPRAAGLATGLRLGIATRRARFFAGFGHATFEDGGRDYRAIRIDAGIAWYAAGGASPWYAMASAGLGGLAVTGGEPPRGVDDDNGGDVLSLGIGRDFGPRLSVEVDAAVMEMGGFLRQAPAPAFHRSSNDLLAVRAMLRYRLL